MIKDSNNDSYICQECGNTTPLAVTECHYCGGKMEPLESVGLRDQEQDKDEIGEESLEKLRSEEEEESETDYRNSFQDSDNPD